MIKVMKLHLELKDTRDVEELKKYGKVTESISRDVLVSENYPLHALHYVIQKLFNWQNSHLHRFVFSEELEKELHGGSFAQYCKLCGHVFRPPYKDDDMNDIYWDDDFRGNDIKAWLKRKYTSPFRNGCFLEHYLNSQYMLETMNRNTPEVPIYPSYEERRKEKTKPEMVKPMEAAFDQMNRYYEHKLGEILERLSVGSVLGLQTTDARGIIDEVEAKSKDYAEDFKEYSRLLQIGKYAEEAAKKAKNSRIPLKILAFEEKAREYGEEYKTGMNAIMAKTDSEPKPITNTINYEYDFGDDWTVMITVVDEYVVKDNKFYKNSIEEVDEELSKKLEDALLNGTPYCVAADGLPVFEDIGGVSGYCDFLSNPENREANRYFARDMGWTGRMGKPECML